VAIVSRDRKIEIAFDPAASLCSASEGTHRQNIHVAFGPSSDRCRLCVAEAVSSSFHSGEAHLGPFSSPSTGWLAENVFHPPWLDRLQLPAALSAAQTFRKLRDSDAYRNARQPIYGPQPYHPASRAEALDVRIALGGEFLNSRM
jgi:hypothetical protein